MSSPYINRFLQPDSIIPDLSNPQSWNRYSYVTNRPVNFNDPSGYREVEGCGDDGKGACHASDLEIALNAQKLAELKYDPTGQKQKKNREVAREVVDEISPDGWKTSIMVSAGWGSKLNANGKKVPTVLYGD